MGKQIEQDIPKRVLDDLNEWTCGGYCLFYLDTEGRPSVRPAYDNPASAFAIQNHIKIWIEAVQQAQINSMSDSFYPPVDVDDDND